MKRIKLYRHIHTAIGIISLFSAVVGFVNCNKLAGLPLQQDATHATKTLNPTINMTAWGFIKSRAIAGDSVFYNIYQGILYSGIDSNEYIQPDRTFIVYHNNGILSFSTTTGKPLSTCYFGKYKVAGKPATSWSQYSQLQVKNHLLSMIVKGTHTFETLSLLPEYDTSLMPKNYDTLNPQSVITFSLSDARNSYLYINSFPGSKYPAVSSKDATPALKVRTAGIISTNGPIHVIDKVLFYQKQ